MKNQATQLRPRLNLVGAGNETSLPGDHLPHYHGRILGETLLNSRKILKTSSAHRNSFNSSIELDGYKYSLKTFCLLVREPECIRIWDVVFHLCLKIQFQLEATSKTIVRTRSLSMRAVTSWPYAGRTLGPATNHQVAITAGLLGDNSIDGNTRPPKRALRELR